MSRFNRLEIDASIPRPVATSLSASVFVSQPGESDALQDADRHRRAGLFEDALRCYSRALELERALITGWLGQVQMLIELQEYPEAELWSRKALELFIDNGDLIAGRAQSLCRMGNWHQAQTLSDQSLAARQQSAYRWMVRGEVMLARGESVASHCFSKAQQADADWLIPLEIGRIYARYGQYANAVSQMRIVVEKAFDQPYVWYLQGVYQQKMGMYRQSGDSLRRCLELSPKHYPARIALESQANRSGVWKRVFNLFRRN